MANVNAPFGFRPIIRIGGIPYSFTTYGKLNTDAQAVFQYDLMFKVASAVPLPESPTGYNVPGAGSCYAAGFTPGQAQPAILGPSANFGAASTQTIHQIADEPDLVMIAQGVTGTSYSTTTHVDKNTNINRATAGSLLTKQSGMLVDSGFANTAALDLRTRSISMISPNAEGQNAIFEVTINQQVYRAGVVGV